MNHKEGVPKGIVKEEPQNGLIRGAPKWIVGGVPKWIVKGSLKIDCKGESQNGLYKGSP